MERYLFFFQDESSFDTVEKMSFNDAIKSLIHICGTTKNLSENTVFQAIDGVDDGNIKELIHLANLFIYDDIKEVYIISDKIY